MRGAIVGDIIGSAFIHSPHTNIDFQLLKPISSYTDDTILTIATADAILNGIAYDTALKQWTRKFPRAGYQPEFLEWALSDKPTEIYKSRGDGAARRISPIGFAAPSLEAAMAEAEKATIITHVDPAKIKASKAFCGAIYLARETRNKEQVKAFMEEEIGYVLPQEWNIDCATALQRKYQSPVPCAIMAFLHASSFEDAIRKAVLMGGPSNTIASITGALAQAYYQHIPKAIMRKSLVRLSGALEEVMIAFEETYCREMSIDKQLQPNFQNQ
ncbi:MULTISPECIES: ADP-ribosylglycohydrolase family protein [unclassified Carboxylicivirga]|uniref:ADP-ribosylglycohydrolase family protein n=1 Tax=Carboxylicivirga TaxID=1628153 RepID=UPI003D348EB0